MLAEEEEKNKLGLDNQNNVSDSYYVGGNESAYLNDKNKNDVSENVDDGEVGDDGEEIVLGKQNDAGNGQYTDDEEETKQGGNPLS